MFQGSFHDFQGCWNVEEMPRSGADSSNWCTMYHTEGKFKDFKDDFQNSRTFQGYSKILNKIQGPFKDFKDRH